MTSRSPFRFPRGASTAGRGPFTVRQPALAWAAAGLAALTVSTRAADAGDEREPLGLSVRVGGLAWFNVKGSVTDTKAPLGAGATFDDGYVLEGSSGPGADTWNWGYQKASQVVNGDTQLEFHRLNNSPRPGSFELGSDPLLGGELVLGFEAFRFDFGKKEARFGAELGYGYLPYSSSGGATQTSNATLTTTRYNLLGITPPPAPYSGPFDGPGPLLPLTPAAPATTVTSAGTGTADATFDVNLHALRFGLWLEYPLTQRVTLTAAFGYSALYADGELRLTESLTFTNPGIPSQAAGTVLVSKTDWLQGAYLEVRGNWRFTKSLSAFAGIEARYQTDFEMPTTDRRAGLDFGLGFGATVGVQFDF